MARLEEESLERRLIAAQRSGVSYQQPAPMHTEGFAALHNGALQTSLSERLAQVRTTRKILGWLGVNCKEYYLNTLYNLYIYKSFLFVYLK